MVSLDVQVTEGERFVSGLAKEDLLVSDEGQRQEIAYFGLEREPLWLVLLLDTSGSMRRYLEPMAATARQALAHLREGDKVAIMPFSRHTRVFTDFTDDFGLAASELPRVVQVELGGGTLINTAVIDAAKHIRDKVGQGTSRRALLVVTDNQGLNYRVPDEAAIRELLESNIVLNALVVGKGRRPGPAPEGANPDFTPPDVFKLAEQTGGEAVKDDRTAVWFPRMLERIRVRYLIQYRPPTAAPGAFRRVQVELAPATKKRHPSASIRVRSGYRVP